jgi:hypothetical protein
MDVLDDVAHDHGVERASRHVGGEDGPEADPEAGRPRDLRGVRIGLDAFSLPPEVAQPGEGRAVAAAHIEHTAACRRRQVHRTEQRVVAPARMQRQQRAEQAGPQARIVAEACGLPAAPRRRVQRTAQAAPGRRRRRVSVVGRVQAADVGFVDHRVLPQQRAARALPVAPRARGPEQLVVEAVVAHLPVDQAQRAARYGDRARRRRHPRAPARSTSQQFTNAIGRKITQM